MGISFIMSDVSSCLLCSSLGVGRRREGTCKGFSSDFLPFKPHHLLKAEAKKLVSFRHPDTSKNWYSTVSLCRSVIDRYWEGKRYEIVIENALCIIWNCQAILFVFNSIIQLRRFLIRAVYELVHQAVIMNRYNTFIACFVLIQIFKNNCNCCIINIHL